MESLQLHTPDPTTRANDSTKDHLKHASLEVDQALTKYGSVMNWPVLALLPNQYPMCVCGQPRGKHLYASTDLLGPKSKGEGKASCNAFKAIVHGR